MRASEARLAWTPAYWPNGRRSDTRGQVEVGCKPRHGERCWSRAYALWDDGTFRVYDYPVDWRAVAAVFIRIHTLIVRDGIDPQVAHKAFLEVDEYRERISPDVEGAE